ncbi:MAG: hypothetical protein V9G19_07455 [Tetrasphaera sp.]
MGKRAGGRDSEVFPSLDALPVVTLNGLGLTPSARRWQVRSGRWQQPHPGVYVTHTGPIDWPTRAAAAILAATRPSVTAIHRVRTAADKGEAAALPERRAGLAGWSAAYVDGLIDLPPDNVTILVPRARVIVPPTGCDVIRSDVQQLRTQVWPPRTTVESTVIFLTQGAAADDSLALIGRTLQQHRSTMARLADELARWPRHRSRRFLQDVLTCDSEGAESALELRWVRDVERPHGIPPATRQVRQVIAGVGRRHDLEFDDANLRVELDGFLFHDRSRSLVDRQKSNATTLIGRGQLRYGWSEVTQEPCNAAAELVASARVRGATWAAHPCRRADCALRAEPAQDRVGHRSPG